MDVFMAINTEILPVTSIRGIILMIAVFVVNGQQLAVQRIEFPSTPCAHKAMDGK